MQKRARSTRASGAGPSQVRAIIAELNGVPGNKSFRDTVKAVAAALESEEGLDREQV
jgi:hypothetical protein